MSQKIVADADSLLGKVLRFDFVVFLMFMKNVMWKTKILTEHLQEEKLNIIDALTAINGSITSLQRMNASDQWRLVGEFTGGACYGSIKMGLFSVCL